VRRSRRGLAGLAAGVAAGWMTQTAQAAGAPVLADHPMVARIWHGRTAAEKADEYRQYLFDAGIKKIASLPGNRGVQMMMSRRPNEAEFIVVSYWDSIEAIKGYAGENYTQVHDLPRDKEFLIDREPLVRHLDLDVNFWQA
jgi:heme-degrading monooxygenase HmoA